MSTLLYVTAHPLQAEQSGSLAVGAIFLEAYRASHPQDKIMELNLFESGVPDIDADLFNAWGKLRKGGEFAALTAEEQQKASRHTELSDQFVAADKIVFVNPMWNHFLPPVLKAYTDALCVAGKTFRYTAQGPEGLLGDKKVLHIQSAGGLYDRDPAAAVKDFGHAYLTHIMLFFGITDIRALRRIMALPEQIIGKLEQLIYQRDEISKSNQQKIQQKIDELELMTEPVSLAELHVLQCIGHYPDYNVISIARAMKLTRGAVSKITARLERKGLAERRQSPANQKEIYFLLTPSGRKLWELHEQEHEQSVQRYHQLLQSYSGEELAAVRRFLDDLLGMNYTVENVRDPFGILSGKRYEFVINLDVPEDDELYVENGVSARVIVKVEEEQTSIVSYDLQETTTGNLLDFDMEEDEEAALVLFCSEHLPE
ncbi:hypothetical protein KC345_g6040 [Hortaea werneckii]|nr:hypothetical protein KC345_g6040 [Hortaea werneckii]